MALGASTRGGRRGKLSSNQKAAAEYAVIAKSWRSRAKARHEEFCGERAIAAGAAAAASPVFTGGLTTHDDVKKVVEAGAVTVLLADVDGCILDLYSNGDSPRGALKSIPQFLAWAQSVGIDCVASGSRRQDLDTEEKNKSGGGLRRSQTTGSHDLLDALGAELGAKFVPIVEGDCLEAGAFVEGKHWASRSRKVVESESVCEKKHEYKIPLLWLQAHYWASRFPDRQVVLQFVDDRSDIINSAASFFANFPGALPGNVTIHFNEHILVAEMKNREVKVDVCEPVTGTGVVQERESLKARYTAFSNAVNKWGFSIDKTYRKENKIRDFLGEKMQAESAHKAQLKAAGWARFRGNTARVVAVPVAAAAATAGLYAATMGAGAMLAAHSVASSVTCSLLLAGSMSALTAATAGAGLAVVGLVVLGYLAYSAYQSCGANRKAAKQAVFGAESTQAEGLRSKAALVLAPAVAGAADPAASATGEATPLLGGAPGHCASAACPQG